MCTVVFIPTKESIVFASLRDESPLRPKAIKPTLFTSNETNYLAPKDTFAGGTWLGANKSSSVIILLNGAFEKHQRQLPYRKSRGLIVSELLESKTPLDLWNTLDLNKIEPFTLIVWDKNSLTQLVWDGAWKHLLNLDSNKAQIWSSSTLYTQEAKSQRETWFENWIQKETLFSNETVFNFFNSISDKQNGFLMNRANKVQTLSYTFMELNSISSISMDYRDLLTNDLFSETLNLK